MSETTVDRAVRLALALGIMRRRTEAAEAEVERLTRECLDRDNTETDARERLRRAEAANPFNIGVREDPDFVMPGNERD